MKKVFKAFLDFHKNEYKYVLLQVHDMVTSIPNCNSIICNGVKYDFHHRYYGFSNIFVRSYEIVEAVEMFDEELLTLS
jgi:hypothetical protein